MNGDGPGNFKARCSKEGVGGSEMVVALMFFLKIIAMPPPRPSVRGWSMYLYPVGVAWLREKWSVGLCQVSVRQIKSSLLSVMNSEMRRLLLLSERVLKEARLSRGRVVG